MLKMKKKYVVDEHNEPVGVILDIETFQELESLLEDNMISKAIKYVEAENALPIDEARKLYGKLKKKRRVSHHTRKLGRARALQPSGRPSKQASGAASEPTFNGLLKHLKEKFGSVPDWFDQWFVMMCNNKVPPEIRKLLPNAKDDDNPREVHGYTVDANGKITVRGRGYVRRRGEVKSRDIKEKRAAADYIQRNG